jgi:capsular exopolysaccharide synthesis family protein
MSRIEEALKRATTTPANSDIVSVHRDRFALAVKPRVRVEDFVAEDPAASVPPPGSTPAVEPSRNALDPASPAIAASSLSSVPDICEGKRISDKGTDPASVEQYRRLATVLHRLQQQNGTKVLMVTSSAPREGKTLTSTNLALALSESYQLRVLLIDGELRRPFVHEMFGIPNITGLSDGLRTDATLAVAQVTSRLTVLPAGRSSSDPMAGLASDRMRRLLGEARERFDWVILDTPPIGLIADANLMASLVDGVIFVIAARATAYQLVEHAINEIGRDRIIGTVLNQVEANAPSATRYYKHYYDGSNDENK